MQNYHFISYSWDDAGEFAERLYDTLLKDRPPIQVWMDKHDGQPGEFWDTQVDEAIRACNSLLFIMTRSSVDDQSVCHQEWFHALQYKKPVIPILFHPDAKMPFLIGSRIYIDFSNEDEFESALDKLRKRLQGLDSPEGILQTLQDRLADTQRDLHRAINPQQKKRLESEIAELGDQIAHQKVVVNDPKGAAKKVEESISVGMEQERQPRKKISDTIRTKFINPPPVVAPSYFQNRFDETKLIGKFLKDDALRLMTVVGRGGIGKTALVCRLLRALENGFLPDDSGALTADGIVYLSAIGSHRVNFPNLYTDLRRLLPDELSDKLDEIYKDPQISIESKMQTLLEAFPHGRTILLLDNFEDVVDPETRNINDTELSNALNALLNLPQHAVKVILTTRIAPKNLALVQPGRQTRIDLDQGLESPFAENILREMDADGKIGLKSASNELLNKARQRTRGYPRALEALFAILSVDRDTTLEEILDDAEKQLPENVVNALIGEAFSRLDSTAQKVMQALAIYGRPVPPFAIDFLLKPFILGVNATPVLNRLVNMQFARKEAGRYYLHPLDRDYALSRIPRGEALDRDADENELPFTQIALFYRGANYFREIRTPSENWNSIADLAPQLAEFDLRFAGEEYDSAANILLKIDFKYLTKWGNYVLVADLHERLTGKLQNDETKQGCLHSLGWIYYAIGPIEKALTYFQDALELAHKTNDRQAEGHTLVALGQYYIRQFQSYLAKDYFNRARVIAKEIKDKELEGKCIHNLGDVHCDLGEVSQAIKCYEQAGEIARETKDRGSEGNNLAFLGDYLRELGQTTRAIEYCEEALDILREANVRNREVVCLGFLGRCFQDKGDTARAIEYFEQAMEIANELRYRLYQPAHIISIGELYVDQGELDKALKQFEYAIQIADKYGDDGDKIIARSNLAIAHLFCGNLSEAKISIGDAFRLFDERKIWYNLKVILGIIAMRQGDSNIAQEAFEAVIIDTEKELSITDEIYMDYDFKAISCCGLALCKGGKDYVRKAKEAYHAARKITKDAGTVRRVLRLFDALAVADTKGILKEVRPVITGSKHQFI